MTLWHISGGVCNDDLQINDQELTESSTCLEMCKGRLQTDKEMNTGIRVVIRRTGDSICFWLFRLSQTLLRVWVLNSLHSLLGLENWSKQQTSKDFATFSFLYFEIRGIRKY